MSKGIVKIFGSQHHASATLFPRFLSRGEIAVVNPLLGQGYRGKSTGRVFNRGSPQNLLNQLKS